MDRGEIVRCLTALADGLARRGIRGELYLVGGAALALAYDARRATRDVDAVFAQGWLNDAVKGFLSGPDREAIPVLDLPGLRVLAASPRYLLAMKCLAARREDEDDIRFLLAHLGLTDAGQALDVVLAVYPEARLLPRTRFMLEEIFQTGLNDLHNER